MESTQTVEKAYVPFQPDPSWRTELRTNEYVVMEPDVDDIVPFVEVPDHYIELRERVNDEDLDEPDEIETIYWLRITRRSFQYEQLTLPEATLPFETVPFVRYFNDDDIPIRAEEEGVYDGIPGPVPVAADEDEVNEEEDLTFMMRNDDDTRTTASGETETVVPIVDRLSSESNVSDDDDTIIIYEFRLTNSRSNYSEVTTVEAEVEDESTEAEVSDESIEAEAKDDDTIEADHKVKVEYRSRLLARFRLGSVVHRFGVGKKGLVVDVDYGTDSFHTIEYEDKTKESITALEISHWNWIFSQGLPQIEDIIGKRIRRKYKLEDGSGEEFYVGTVESKYSSSKYYILFDNVGEWEGEWRQKFSLEEIFEFQMFETSTVVYKNGIGARGAVSSFNQEYHVGLFEDGSGADFDASQIRAWGFHHSLYAEYLE